MYLFYHTLITLVSSFAATDSIMSNEVAALEAELKEYNLQVSCCRPNSQNVC